MNNYNPPVIIFCLVVLQSLLLPTLCKTQSNIPIVKGHSLEERLVLINNNFILEERLPVVKSILERAAASCYTGVIVIDPKIGYINTFSEDSYYRNNLDQFFDYAVELGLDVYPTVANFGHSAPILYHNPNLAEGLPVKNAPFVVESKEGQLVLVNDPEEDPLNIRNGNFESSTGTEHFIPGWDNQDEPGQLTFLDNAESHSGTASLKITNLDKNAYGRGRVSQLVGVPSFRDYYVSVWVKTEAWEKGYVQFLAIDEASNRQLTHNEIRVVSNQDWTQYELTFNTLDSRNVSLFLGVWDGGNGTIWFDDLTVKPTTFNNIIRRENTPVQIKRSNGQLLTEGQATDSILDPLSGYDPFPGNFTVWHQQPEIGIPASSPLQEGDKILVDYFHTAVINWEQTSASLTEPEALRIAEDQLKWIKDIMEPKSLFKGWLLTHDEIRIHNWDNSPDFGSPSNNLTYNIQEVHKRARVIDPTAELMVWSDMFDQFHNASKEVDPYYLVNGSWEGSWEGLPQDITILNWQFRDRINSGTFFSNKGYEQILCGYYDQADFYTPKWLEEMEGQNGIKGVMFTTWYDNYSRLETWAEEVWGGCSNLSTFNPTVDIKSELIVRPNPGTQQITVELKGGLEINKILIMDTGGKIVFDQNNFSTGSAQLNINAISAGTYFLIVHTTDKKVSLYKKITFM